MWCWILIWLSCASLCYYISSPAFLSSTGHLIKTALRFSIFLLISNFESGKSRVIGLHNMHRAYVSQSAFVSMSLWIAHWNCCGGISPPAKFYLVFRWKGAPSFIYIPISCSKRDFRGSCVSANHPCICLPLTRSWRRWHVMMTRWCRCVAGWVSAVMWSLRSCTYASVPCVVTGWSTSTGVSPTTER